MDKVILSDEYVSRDWCQYSPTLVPTKFCHRYDDTSGNRFYFFEHQDRFIPAAGITSWLKKVLPESKFLTEWKLKHGDNWERVLNLTSDYGTLFHTCIAYIHEFRAYPPAEYILAATDAVRELRKYDSSIHKDMIKRNLVSYLQFMEDYSLEPLLIESQLVVETSSGVPYCLTLDNLSKVKYIRKEKRQEEDGVFSRGKNKGEKRYKTVVEETEVEEIWLIDYKSNPFDKDTKSFFDSHAYQLIAAKKAIKQNFGIEVDKVFNWSPLSWNKRIGDYALKEHKLTQDLEESFQIYEALAERNGAFRPKGKLYEFKEWKTGMKASELAKGYSYEEYINR